MEKIGPKWPTKTGRKQPTSEIELKWPRLKQPDRRTQDQNNRLPFAYHFICNWLATSKIIQLLCLQATPWSECSHIKLHGLPHDLTNINMANWNVFVYIYILPFDFLWILVEKAFLARFFERKTQVIKMWWTWAGAWGLDRWRGVSTFHFWNITLQSLEIV